MAVPGVDQPIVEYIRLVGADRPSFVVDNTVQDVAISAHSLAKLQNALSKWLFIPADPVMVLGAAIVPPHCFVMGTEPATIQLTQLLAGDTAEIDLANFTAPVLGAEFLFAGAGFEGMYFPHRDIAAAVPVNCYCRAKMTNLRVSCVGVPDLLNGTTQRIEVMIKVQHMKALTS